MVQTRQRLEPGDIEMFKPVKADIVTQGGQLLLSRGKKVTTDEMRLKLLKHGYKVIHAATGAAAHVPVFTRMEHLAHRLSRIEEEIANGGLVDGWLLRVTTLVADIIATAAEDHDAAFAVIHLEARHKYDVVHHLMAGLICARLAPLAGLSDKATHSIVCAAVTHDIAVLAMRQEIEKAERLTESQRLRIKEHPAHGVDMLRRLGVTDALWLRVVLHHHEYLDGSGYFGLTGDALDLPVRIMALADAMSAMLRPRPYRERKLAKQALADLYADADGKYDKSLVTKLILELGLFPPGTLLRLANFETAVALRSYRDRPGIPDAVAVADHAGHPLQKALKREIGVGDARIAAILEPDVACKYRHLLPLAWGGN